jgi:hypothetical protein
VSAEEICNVLDHARQFSVKQWAEFFQVHPQTVKGWRTKGLTLQLWGNPTEASWDSLKGEAVRNLWKVIGSLEGRTSQPGDVYLPAT